MSVVYGKFEMPAKIIVEEENATSTFARFIAEPFERSIGHTMGVCLRRMLLSSIEAPGIISVRVGGVPHEYSAVDGVIEDMINIVLNFKGALLRKIPTDEESNARKVRMLTHEFEVTQDDLDSNGGKYSVTLGHVISDSYFEILNPDLHLFTATKPMKKQIDVKVAMGRGYVPSERHDTRDKRKDEIFIDTAFSPIRLVKYFVENTRVGQDTDYDKLVLEVTTDGRITPKEALTFASQIVTSHFEFFTNIEDQQMVFEETTESVDSDQDDLLRKLALKIDEIELSVRSTNCLSGANILTIAELVTIPEKRMLEFRNFGKKSLNEIKAKLTEMGLHLGMDLNYLGINQENAREKMFQYHEEQAKASVPCSSEEIEIIG